MIQFLKAFAEMFLGTPNYVAVSVSFVYCLLGAFLSLLLDSNKRDVCSTRTPTHFSYLFLFKDNINRISATFILIIVFMRFSKELMGVELTTYWAFFIGLVSDKLSEYLRNVKRAFFSNGKLYNQTPESRKEDEDKKEDEQKTDT